VVSGGQAALPPARFIDGLSDRHGRGDAVRALRGDRAGHDFADKRLLSAGTRLRRDSRRRPVPAVLACGRRWRAGRPVMRRCWQSGDGGRARAGRTRRGGWP
jgi:hypothetical protein